MKNGNHFIFSIYSENDKLLNFERVSLKTAENSYKHILKFIKKIGLKNYEVWYNKVNSEPQKIVMSYQEYEPCKETIIFEKSYEDFINDLEIM